MLSQLDRNESTDTKEVAIILKQYYLACLAHDSYLIGDETCGTAAVVDPQRDFEQYLEDARKLGLQIRHVFLTHFHADFLAGHLELRNRAGAEIYLGARARSEFKFHPLKNGDKVEFGKVRLQVLETPGHTPESISILVFDLAKDAQRPHAVLTGDTLFIGDVGRPDLMASQGVTANELGEMLYDSLRTQLLTLPDETLVYPAHGAGSMCGKNLSTDTFSTIGTQRRYNYALQPMRKEEFVQLVTADQPEAPAYFAYDAQLNREERPTLEETLHRELTPLSLEDVLQKRTAGAQLLDVREASDFAGAHVIDSLNIGLDGKFATWAGTLLQQDKPIVIIAERGKEVEAATRLGRIGFDHVAGFLQGGLHAMEFRPDLLSRTERIIAASLREQLDSPTPPVVLDVRSAKEWDAHHIEGSFNLPLPHLRQRVGEVPRERRVVVHCASGYRSSTAVSVLAHLGFSNTVDLVGGIAAWDKTPVKGIQPANV